MSPLGKEGEQSVIEPLKAWITYVRKDGGGRHIGTIATNPAYVKAHKDWVWLPIDLPSMK